MKLRRPLAKQSRGFKIGADHAGDFLRERGYIQKERVLWHSKLAGGGIGGHGPLEELTQGVERIAPGISLVGNVID
jgi:hypothetical protein